MGKPRVALGAELDELIGELAAMGRLSGQIMITASVALLEADPALAELAVVRGYELDAQHHDVQQRCVSLLAAQSPAADQRIVVAVMDAAGDLRRMGTLAQHTANITRLRHPDLTVSDDERAAIAQMSLVTGRLALLAAAAIEVLDPRFGDRLARGYREVNALRCQLFHLAATENGSHRETWTGHGALMGHFHERFAGHAVEITRRLCAVVA